MGTLSPGEQPLDVTRFDVESASDLLGTWVRHTPVAELERGAFGVPGRLVLKLELLQHTGSFKPRGAFNRMLTADIDETGVLAASGGNFGLAVAYAAYRLGHPAEIFVPSTSPPMKIERIRSYGATVHVVDGFYAEAFAACEERAFDTGAAFLHPYDQPAVVAGADADRFEVVGGSFFESVPEGGDAYLLKSVLHDWDDEPAIEILRVCRRAARAGTALLVVERQFALPGTKLSDLNMLVGPGGRERTADEYAALLAAAGYELLGETPTAVDVSVLEARAI